jgi:hypothetical protein
MSANKQQILHFSVDLSWTPSHTISTFPAWTKMAFPGKSV